MNVRYILVSAIFVGLCRADKSLVEFIKDYYQAYNIHQIVIFGCWDYAADMSQSIMNLNTVVTYQSTSSDIDLKRILRVNYYHVGVILDLDCPSSERILDRFSNELNFNESYYWLVLSTMTQLPSDYLGTLKLNIASEFTFAIRNEDEFHLHDVYNPSYRHGSAVKVIHKGWWTPGDGLKDELTEYKYVRRADLEKLTLNVSFPLVGQPVPDLMTYLAVPLNKGVDTMPRSHYTLAVYLQDMYNFNMKIHLTDTWGYLINGTFNGLIGDMIAGFIDMSITPFEYHHDRMNFVDYTVSTWYADKIFTFRHPKSSTLKNNFLMPFTDDLWLMVVLVGMIYWITLLISLKLESHYDIESSVTSNTNPISETGLTTVAALSQQGVSDSPNCYSGRITVLFLFLWALLLYQFYSASIVSSLLTPPPHWIKTIKDLAESELEVGYLKNIYYSRLFATSTDPDYVDLYNKKIKNPKRGSREVALPLSQGFKEVQKGGYAYVTVGSATYQIITDTFTEDEICELQEIPVGRPQKIAPILPKGSPFRKMIIYGLRKIVQSGLLNRVWKTWRTPRPICPESHNSEPTAMSMKEFSPALFLLCIGVACSLLLLAIELLYSHIESKWTIARNDSFETTSVISENSR